MSRPTLSVLICHLPERVAVFLHLWRTLAPQCTERVQVLVDASVYDPIGTKRNRLLQAASEDYVWFIDDDDTIADDAIARILAALDANPGVDCLGTEGWVTFNGPLRDPRSRYLISRSCEKWHFTNGIYYRTPNHITPIRRELAQQCVFPDTNHGEDADWSRQVWPLLKTEATVRGTLYTYHSRAKGPQ